MDPYTVLADITKSIDSGTSVGDIGIIIEILTQPNRNYKKEEVCLCCNRIQMDIYMSKCSLKI